VPSGNSIVRVAIPVLGRKRRHTGQVTDALVASDAGKADGCAEPYVNIVDPGGLEWAYYRWKLWLAEAKTRFLFCS